MIAALATLAWTLPASGAGAAAGGCAPAGARVLAAAGGARLYVTGSALYGCLAGGRRTRLGGAPSGSRLGATRVALYAVTPRYAGIDTLRMGVDTLASSVSIVDLRSGATLASAPASTPENRAESFQSASALVLAPDGTLAWIGSRSAVGAFAPIREVHTLDAAGAERMLASGTAIAPHSLALSGGTLRWTQDGHARHAPLRP